MRKLDEITGLLAETRDRLVARYGDAIRKVIVYGSFARGTATEDSDIDLAVTVADSLDPRKVRKALDDFLFDVLLERKELVAVLPIRESDFNAYNYPVFLSIKAEGIPV